MNKQQRKQLGLELDALIVRFTAEMVKSSALLEEGRRFLGDILTEALEVVESTREEEQDKFDNMPESLQSSSRGEDLQTTIEYLESAASQLEEAKDCLEDHPAEVGDEEGWDAWRADVCGLVRNAFDTALEVCS